MSLFIHPHTQSCITVGTQDSDSSLVTNSLSSILSGSSIFTIGHILTNVFGFITQVLLTRLLNASGYGIFSYGQTILLLMLNISNMGTDKSLMRYLPSQAGNRRFQQATLTLAYGTSLVASICAAAFLIITAPIISTYTINNPIFVSVLRLFAAILIIDTIMQVTSTSFRALEMAQFDVAIRKIGRQGSLLLAAAVAFFLGLNVFSTTILAVVASMITLGCAVALAFRHLDIRPSRDLSEANLREYYNYSIPLSAKDMGSFFYTKADVLMVGIFFSASAVGVYNIAVLLAAFITLPLGAVNQLFPPIAAKLYSSDSNSELDEVYSAVSRWAMTGALPLAVGAIIYRTELLALFGAEFATGGAILIVLALAKFADTAVGPSGYMLMMTDHQYLLLINQWSFALLNIILNYFFLLWFGVIGAAYASAIVLASLNLLRVSEVYYLEGMHPFSLSFFKPVLAGFPASGTMLIVLLIIPNNPFVAMILGGSVGCIVYLLTLFALGIEESDRKLYDSIS